MKTKPEYLTVPDNYVRKPLPMKTEWMAALKSGNYEQCSGVLREKEQYCCLGVLCEIQGRLKIIDSRWTDNGYPTTLSEENPLVSFLDKNGMFCGNNTLSVEYEIYCTRVIDGEEKKLGCLTELNDYGFSFSEIADVIDYLWLDPATETP